MISIFGTRQIKTTDARFKRNMWPWKSFFGNFPRENLNKIPVNVSTADGKPFL